MSSIGVNPPLRVAYLINRYPSISHSFIRREIQALGKQGVKVSRVALRGWDEATPDSRDAAELKETAYVLRGGPLPLLAAAGAMFFGSPVRWFKAFLETLSLSWKADRSVAVHLIYFLEACWLARHMLEQRVEHLHAHFGTNPATVALIAAILTGKSWSFTVHGPEEFDKPEALKLRQKMEAAAFTVAISCFGRGQLFRWVDAQQWGKIKVVHCALEPDYFGSLAISRSSGMPTRLLCVGRLCEQKGQLLLIEAVRQLVAEGLDLQLVLAGDGEMRGKIEQAISAAGLAGRVTISGWLSSDQVGDQIARCTALVLPSFAEGLPVVLMEAMALGRPVISTYVAGIPELVQAGDNGWLVPSGSVSELTAAIREVALTSPERLDEMGRAGQQRCIERHSVEVEVKKLVHLFAVAIGRPESDSPLY